MIPIFLIFFPLICGLLFLFLSGEKVKHLALISSLISLILSAYTWIQFNNSPESVLLKADYAWIPSFGVHFSVAVDGISLLLVLLTNLLFPLILLSSFNKSYPQYFYTLTMLMQSALLGVFTATDGFLFYVFWESALIPIYFICLLWGGENRAKITFKFFAYTLFGSLLMLIAFIAVYLKTPGTHSFSINALYQAGSLLSVTEQSWIFLAIFVAFAIKMPIFPFHTWQPNTYTTAPTQGTMLLAGIMLKMGAYGLIRWLIPLVPLGFQKWGFTAIVLSVIGIIYASCLALVQKDFKRLIAYSSIAHVGLISAGILCFNLQGLQGGLFQMFSHGLIIVGLFFIGDILSSRTGTQTMTELGGIVNHAPEFSKWFLIILLGSIAFPLTNGFVGEFLLLNGLYQYKPLLCFFGGFTVILGAVYMLKSYQTLMLGESNIYKAAGAQNFKDLTRTETAVLLPIAILILILGVYPSPLLKMTEPSVQLLLQNLKMSIP